MIGDPARSILTVPNYQVADQNGHATFTLESPPEGSVLTGSLAVPGAPSGAQFHATAANTDWGSWSGNAHHSPVQSHPQVPITVAATGLLPGVGYTMSFTGTVHGSGFEPDAWPTTALTTPFVNQTLQASKLFNFAAAGVGDFQQFGPYPTQGFASLRLAVGSPIVAGELAIQIWWLDVSSNIIAERFCVVNEVAALSVQTPHEGDYVQIIVTNPGANPLTSQIAVSQTTETSAAFAGLESQLEQDIAVGTPGSTTQTLLNMAMVFAGPAYVHLNPSTAATWTAHLYAKDPTGNLIQLARWDQTVGAEVRETVLVPPWPISLDFTNAGAAVTPSAAIVFDGWRTG